MNAYSDTGGLVDLGGSTSSEETRKRLPGARLVKAFNTIYYQHLGTRGDPNLPLEQRNVIFIAGDDPEAKQIVANLIGDIGFAPVDTGDLREGGRRQQPNSPIYNRPMTPPEAERILNSWPRTAAG